MSANIDRMMYVGEVPWHKSGKYVGEQNVNSAEAIAAAGLDWHVSLRPITAKGGIEIPDKLAVIRDDTRVCFDVVSPRYQPLQNRDAFKFFDSVVGEGQAIYHTAGSLGKGEVVWMLAKLPLDGSVKGDKIEQFLLLTNSFDRSLAFRMFFTPIRVVCQNTLNMAYGEAGGYRRPHFKTTIQHLSVREARNALGLAAKFHEGFIDMANHLAEQTMTAKEFTAFSEAMFPALPAPTALLALPSPKASNYVLPEVIQKHRAELEWLYLGGVGNDRKDIRGTKWAALNAVAEWTDYVGGHNGTRSKSLLFGKGAQLKQRALNYLVSK